ncbi:ROK family transcriptional regulator [Sphingomonas sp. BAUL-RG-20F-R05-02]|uniref:ROK family transcriptional regulator n=1 Tax=Sphingomonas sp. BAUL-RG-20F-R05-02 TaxID=2914830 RepID=UPI001F57CDC7|nr:ROK family transcriptional regulator [Sphingomonas sp. BAUL-RG-20F-R05-02]
MKTARHASANRMLVSVPVVDGRGTRLAASLSGTNLARAGDYNQRTVLQAIRLDGETTRVALAQQTGLTSPTIANITGRLIDQGLVRVPGRLQGARGQPALRLTINPDGAFAIGLNIDRDHITLVALDLAGEVRSRLSCEIAFAMPEDVIAYVERNLDLLIAEGSINRDHILGVGVALPDDLGRISLPRMPPGYECWSDLDVASTLGSALHWPVHVDNDAAAAAVGESQSRSSSALSSFFYLLISAGLGGGPVVDGSYFRGADARSGEIGLMPDLTSESANALVQDTVSLSALRARLESVGRPIERIDQLLTDDPMINGTVMRWIEDATRSLIAPLIAVNCLINPAAVLIGGRLPMPLINHLCDALNAALAKTNLPKRAVIQPAAMAGDAPAIGAAILPFLDHLLPSDAILIQAGR